MDFSGETIVVPSVRSRVLALRARNLTCRHRWPVSDASLFVSLPSRPFFPLDASNACIQWPLGVIIVAYCHYWTQGTRAASWGVMMRQRRHSTPPQGDDWPEAFSISLLHAHGAYPLVTCGRVLCMSHDIRQRRCHYAIRRQ
jgi:hypothetical protein